VGRKPVKFPGASTRRTLPAAVLARHGLPARKASEAGFTGSDLSVVLLAYVDAGLTTSAFGRRGVAAEVAAGVDLAARSGVGLLDPCLRPVRNREDLGCHTAKASTAWAVPHVLRLRALGSVDQVASVVGTAGVLLFAATAAHAGVPDSRLIAPAAPDSLRGHGAVCGRCRPRVQHWCRLVPTGCRYPPLVTTGSGGGSTVQDSEGFRNRREARRGSHVTSVSTVIAAVIGAVVGSLGGAYLGVAVGADRDDERSNREFLRTQRVALYGEYLAAVDEARSLIDPVHLDLNPDGTFILDAVTIDAEQTAALARASGRVATLQGQIYVIAGDEVAEAAQTVTGHITWISDLTEYVGRCRIDVSYDDGCASQLLADEAALRGVPELEAAHRQYMRAARQELQVPE